MRIRYPSIYTGKSQDTRKLQGSRVMNAIVDIVENNTGTSNYQLLADFVN